MVKATTSLDTVRHDLTTIEGGWVELRPMTYGQFLRRRDMATKMAMNNPGRGIETVNIDMMQEAVTRYEFNVCIADHNLEDENGRKLTLSEENDFAKLDPRIGQEINGLIEEMTQWEDPKSSDGPPAGHQTGNPFSKVSSSE